MTLRFPLVRIKTVKEKIVAVALTLDGETVPVTASAEITLELPMMSRSRYLRLVRAYLHKEDVDVILEFDQGEFNFDSAGQGEYPEKHLSMDGPMSPSTVIVPEGTLFVTDTAGDGHIVV